MKCIICNSNSKYYFTTDFATHHSGKFKTQLDKSQYYKCVNCGFTFSKTIYEMSYKEWVNLNLSAHTNVESASLESKLANQPPYLAQASMINLLIKNNIIKNISPNGGG